MLRKLKLTGMTALMAVLMMLPLKAEITPDYENNSQSSEYQDIKIDRYLDAEVWTNHTDNEFYVGDNIVLSYRTNRDAFVAIYSIDTRGRVNLLFPTSPDDNNYIEGGVTYRLPDRADDFDFVVSGPEGVETIQIIASKERFPIPDWYPTSGIIMDAEDRHEFADYINSRYFVRYGGQRFAFDRSSIYINEWEDYYYRPVYYPDYPNWTVSGNIYIDYPYGGSVYINGVYWGVAPLYIPRIYVGWHTFTVYDHWGHCWEHDIHVTRYNTVVLDRTIIKTSPTIRSKYKEVRSVGYRDPVKNGYPKYKSVNVSNNKVVVKDSKNATVKVPATKKYARGSTQVVKTDRGYETTGNKSISTKRETSKNTYDRKSTGSSGTTDSYKRKQGSSTKETGSYKSKPNSSSGSTGTYRKKTGSSKSDTPDRKSSSSKVEKRTYKKPVKKAAESSDAKKKSSSDKKVESKKSSGSDSKSSGKSSSGKTTSGSKKKKR